MRLGDNFAGKKEAKTCCALFLLSLSLSLSLSFSLSLCVSLCRSLSLSYRRRRDGSTLGPKEPLQVSLVDCLSELGVDSRHLIERRDAREHHERHAPRREHVHLHPVVRLGEQMKRRGVRPANESTDESVSQHCQSVSSNGSSVPECEHAVVFDQIGKASTKWAHLRSEHVNRLADTLVTEGRKRHVIRPAEKLSQNVHT